MGPARQSHNRKVTLQRVAPAGYTAGAGLYHEPEEKDPPDVLKRAGPTLYNELFQGLTRQARRVESYNAHSLSEEGS